MVAIKERLRQLGMRIDNSGDIVDRTSQVAI